jgi:hypothetical protein
MNIGPQTNSVLRALRENSESGDRDGWRIVYLDNAKASEQCSDMRQYEPIDGYAWGRVKMTGDVEV